MPADVVATGLCANSNCTPYCGTCDANCAGDCIVNTHHHEIDTTEITFSDVIDFEYDEWLRGIAEWAVTRRWVFRWMLRKLVAHKERLTDSLIEASRRELLRPGAVRAALSYYRAAFRWPIKCPRTIEAPTLILWGDRDPALDPRLLDDLPARIEQVEVHHVEDAGHFVHWDDPERVLSELVSFLK